MFRPSSYKLKGKDWDRDDNPSVADGNSLMMAKRKEQIRPQRLPPSLSGGFRRELEHSLFAKMNRTGELPSTPPLPRKEFKISEVSHIYRYICVKRTLSIFKTGRKYITHVSIILITLHLKAYFFIPLWYSDLV